MDCGDGPLRYIKAFVYSIRGTLGFAALLGVVFATQLAVVEHLGYDTAYQVINEHIRTNTALYVYGSHLVHSSLSHLLWNLGFLLISGAITERKVGWRRLVTFVYVAGLLSNTVPALLGFGGFGVGISGANFGLWAFFGLLFAQEGRRDDEDHPGFNILLALLGTVYALFGVSQYVGLLPAPPGTAKGAHLLGIILGVVWFSYYQVVFRSDFSEIRLRA